MASRSHGKTKCGRGVKEEGKCCGTDESTEPTDCFFQLTEAVLRSPSLDSQGCRNLQSSKNPGAARQGLPLLALNITSSIVSRTLSARCEFSSLFFDLGACFGASPSRQLRVIFLRKAGGAQTTPSLRRYLGQACELMRARMYLDLGLAALGVYGTRVRMGSQSFF